MAHRKNFAGIDYFRLAAAFMVIAIHTAPLSSWNETADFMVTYCLARIAVPFFFMVTGYFVFAPYLNSGFRKKSTLFRFLRKNTALYLGASLLYLPVMIYSGKLPQSIPVFFKKLFFDGTFYHLWYFPAVLMGCLLLMLLCRVSVTFAAACSAALYAFGLLGDSYYGAIKGIPFMAAVMNRVFAVSSHTRNGIFFAPVFILLGALIAVYRIRMPKINCRMGLAVSLICLLAEGYFTYRLKLQKHNSMYLFLLPAMFFLFELLLSVKGRAPGWIRNGSMLLYVIHPAAIVVWRGAVKALKLPSFFMDNSFIKYFAVCLLSVAAVCLLQFLAALLLPQGRPGFSRKGAVNDVPERSRLD